jgi:chemotaxis protein histidine kinase CheA
MAEIRNDTPGITTYSDHEVIVTPNRLKKAVRRAGADERDPIVDAEAALVELSAQFGIWMEDECAELDKARHLLHAEGFTEAARQRLFRAAHDIKGHGATFGFPIAAEVADSLCRLIEPDVDLSPAPLTLIDQCVDAVRAIIREHDRAHADRTAAELAESLRTLVDDLLAAPAGEQGSPEAAPAPPLVPAAKGES